MLFGDVPGDSKLEEKDRLLSIKKNGMVYPNFNRISQEARTFLENTLKYEEEYRWTWE